MDKQKQWGNVGVPHNNLPPVLELNII